MKESVQEKLILKHLKNKDQKIYESVFRKHYASLVKFASKFLVDQSSAEDAVQTVFIYMWEHSHKINIKNSVQNYLYQAVKNACLNHLRSIKIRDKYQLLNIEAVLNSENNEVFHDDKIMDAIQLAVSNLPEKMRLVFQLKYVNELSVKAIADDLSLSENTVKVHLHKSRILIRKSLELAR